MEPNHGCRKLRRLDETAGPADTVEFILDMTKP